MVKHYMDFFFSGKLFDSGATVLNNNNPHKQSAINLQFLLANMNQ